MAEQLEMHLSAGTQARREGRLDEAAQHYALALIESRAHGEKLRTAHIARHLGDIHRENGLSGEAEPLLKEAVEIYRSSLDTKVLDLANALRPLALLHDSLGDHRSAQELWQEARALYSAIGVADGVSECDSHLNASSLS
jgi:tetratricopeptide (TPR) repeat protein